MTVVGMGERKTPKSFISACNRFKYLDILATAEQKEPEKPAQPEKPKQQPKQEKARPAPKQEPKPEPKPEPELAPEPCPEPEEKQMTGLRTIKKAIRTIVAENSDEDGWLFIGTIGNLLVKRYPDFDVRNFGFSKLTPFIESLDLFDIKSVRTRDSSVKLIYVKLK